MPFAATARSRRRGHWCSSPRSVVTTYAAINTELPVVDSEGRRYPEIGRGGVGRGLEAMSS